LAHLNVDANVFPVGSCERQSDLMQDEITAPLTQPADWTSALLIADQLNSQYISTNVHA